MSAIDIARNYIRAAQTGDQALLARTVSPTVVWHQPGANRFSGTHRGLAAVGAMIGGMMEVSRGTFAITEAQHYMENGDWVAISIRFAGEREGARLDQAGRGPAAHPGRPGRRGLSVLQRPGAGRPLLGPARGEMTDGTPQ